MIVLTPLLLLLACTPAAPDSSAVADTSDTGATDSGGGDTGSNAIVTWYFGTSDGQTPDGSYQEPEEDLLFIRTVDPEASTIHEEVWTSGAKYWTAYDLLHVVDAAQETFTSNWVTDDGTLEVIGAFDEGDPWAWTAWHSTSTYQDGKYAGEWITSEDQTHEDGSNTAIKEVYDADSNHIWSIVEVLTPTTEDKWKDAFSTIEVQ